VFAGPNPPEGAILTYYLGTEGNGRAAIAITDAQGRVVREIESAAGAGFNRVVWDLRAAAPPVSGLRGPFVLPGTYTVTVRESDRESSAPLRVDPDPAFATTQAEREARFTFLTEAVRMQATLMASADALREVRVQLVTVQERVKTVQAPRTTTEAIDRLLSAMTDVQGRLGGGGGGEEGGGFGSGLRSRIGGLISEIDGSGVQQGTLSGPTAGQLERLNQARQDLQAVEKDVERLLGPELTALNEATGRLNLPRIERIKK
jgi:hypothetical protein